MLATKFNPLSLSEKSRFQTPPLPQKKANMKLFAVVAAAAVSSTLAACTVDGTGCKEDTCKYIPAVPEIKEKKDKYGCTYTGPVSECKDGKSNVISGAAAFKVTCGKVTQSETKADVKCADTKGSVGGKTDTPCEDITIKGNAAAAAKPAKCVEKSCADYASSKDKCNAQAKCEYKEKVDGSAATYKCKSQAGNTKAMADLCGKTAVAKITDSAKCTVAANGGQFCCKIAAVIDKPGSPAMCVEKKQDTSSAGTAVLSAFAAVSAALLI